MLGSVNTFLNGILETGFIILGVLALVDYWRHRSQVSRDMALFFTTLAVAATMLLLESLGQPSISAATTLMWLALLALPPLLLRLLRYFRSVPRWIWAAAAMGTALGWMLAVIDGPQLSPPALTYAALFIAVFAGYATVTFVAGAFTTLGVPKQRLRCMAIGSGLLAATLLWALIGAIFPAANAIVALMIRLTAIAAALSYYLGLLPPAWLRRAWQLAVFRNFLLTIAANMPLQSRADVFALLAPTMRDAVNGSGVRFLISKAGAETWQIHTPAVHAPEREEDTAQLADAPPFDTEETICLPATALDADSRHFLNPGEARWFYLVPIPWNGQIRALAVVFLEYGSLFVEDDLQLLNLFAEQSALRLENLDLVDQLRAQARDLEQRVRERTDELIRRNREIELLHEITVAANESTSIDAPLQKAIDLLCTSFAIPVGHVFSPTESSPHIMSSTAIWHLAEPERYASFREVTEQISFAQHLGGVGQVANDEEARWFTDVTERPDFVRARSARECGIQTGIFIPVSIRKNVVAVLELFSDRSLEPDARLLAFMTSVGAQLGRVIERRRAELALHESERRFRTIANAAPMPLVISRKKDGQILYANKTAATFHGVEVDELVGMTAQRLYRGSTERKDLISLLEREGGIRDHKMRVRRARDGTFRWLSVTVAPIHFDGEEAFSTTFIDITDTRRAQEALRESEKRFRNTFEQAAVGMAHVAPNGRFLRLNQRYCDILGYSKSELEALTFQEITDPDDLHRDLNYVRETLEGKRNDYLLEKRYLNKAGEIVWVQLTVSLVRSENGNPEYFITVVEDIDERKRLERELLKLNEELEQRVKKRTAHLRAVNKELEAFSYSVSHDLRAPLRAVDGFSQAILEDYHDEIDEVGRDFLQRIRAESQRMGQLIDDLIGLARLSRRELEITTVDLSELARAIVANLREQAPQRTVEIVIRDTPPACADRGLAEIVMSNLLENAWKFTSRTTDAKVEVGATRRDGTVEYCVCDNGAGFDMAYVDKLFGAFQRLHSMTEYEGTGVGLATVQRIVHRHGGTIRAEGAVNRGARFYFTFGGNECG